jgi:hypothetical protein
MCCVSFCLFKQERNRVGRREASTQSYNRSNKIYVAVFIPKRFLWELGYVKGYITLQKHW